MNARILSDCRYEQTLKKDVLDPERCCRCGTCGAVCPKLSDTRHFNPLMRGPLQGAGSAACEVCAECCPIRHSKEHEGLGTVLMAASAQAAQDHRHPHAQDGGACSAFLSSLTNHSIVSVGHDAWQPVPTCTTSGAGPAGTVYAATASLSALQKARGPVAFVGVPCQMRGITLAQGQGLLTQVTLKVGLFCTKTFDHVKLKAAIEDTGIPMGSITSMRIKSALIVTTEDGKDHRIGLSALSDAVVPGCGFCPEFSAWESDISFGAIGSPEGHTTVLIRSERAKALFEDAVRRNYINLCGNIDMEAVLQHQERKRGGYRHG